MSLYPPLHLAIKQELKLKAASVTTGLVGAHIALQKSTIYFVGCPSIYAVSDTLNTCFDTCFEIFREFATSSISTFLVMGTNKKMIHPILIALEKHDILY